MYLVEIRYLNGRLRLIQNLTAEEAEKTRREYQAKVANSTLGIITVHKRAMPIVSQ